MLEVAGDWLSSVRRAPDVEATPVRGRCLNTEGRLDVIRATVSELCPNSRRTAGIRGRVQTGQGSDPSTLVHLVTRPYLPETGSSAILKSPGSDPL